MKVAARVLLILASLPVAYWVMAFAVRFTLLPLGHGFMEGTPLTLVVEVTVFPLTLIAVLVIGHILLNRLFRRRFHA